MRQEKEVPLLACPCCKSARKERDGGRKEEEAGWQEVQWKGSSERQSARGSSAIYVSRLRDMSRVRVVVGG